MIKDAISIVSRGRDMDKAMASEVIDEIMSGVDTESQIAGLLTAMHIKEETIDEITAFAEGMRRHSQRVNGIGDVTEIVGTGGDCMNSFNISTTSAFVAAAAGVRIAKHGNRAASSKCGTADVLEELGVKISLSSEGCMRVMNSTGMCFMFAQKYHSAMKYVAGPRKELGIPTIFNILGPLSNPAHANHQLFGVYDVKLLRPMAEVLKNLGLKNAMVIRGADGLDEISAAAVTEVCELNCDGTITSYVLDPRDYGFEFCDPSELVGGDKAENAKILRDVLSGDKGGKRTAVLLNAGSAIHLATGCSIEEGIEAAKVAIDNGLAFRKMEEFIEATQVEE
jgi:anthranilate phosphoribosyltransferase